MTLAVRLREDYDARQLRAGQGVARREPDPASVGAGGDL
jgi:hypothetical protein